MNTSIANPIKSLLGSINFRPYIGLPYRDRGRSEDGIDCWGIPYLIYSREAGIKLADYGEISAYDLLAIAKEIGKHRAASNIWRPLGIGERLQPLDIVVMAAAGKPARIPHHVGVMMNDHQMLHAEQGRDSHVSEITDTAIFSRILDFHRHKGLEVSQ